MEEALSHRYLAEVRNVAMETTMEHGLNVNFETPPLVGEVLRKKVSVSFHYIMIYLDERRDRELRQQLTTYFLRAICCNSMISNVTTFTIVCLKSLIDRLLLQQGSLYDACFPII